MKKIALCVVDMQRYYLEKESSYYKYFDKLFPESLNYILERCENIVTPNIQNLIKKFREKNSKIYFLKLCSEIEDRSDLHPFFENTNNEGEIAGFQNIYPLSTDPFSDVTKNLRPEKHDTIIKKTTFSAFTSSNILEILKKDGIDTIVFCGLATSQCVESTARDASDNGFKVIQIEDAQADYNEEIHQVSLYSSQGVCGGTILDTKTFIND